MSIKAVRHLALSNVTRAALLLLGSLLIAASAEMFHPKCISDLKKAFDVHHSSQMCTENIVSVSHKYGTVGAFSHDCMDDGIHHNDHGDAMCSLCDDEFGIKFFISGGTSCSAGELKHLTKALEKELHRNGQCGHKQNPRSVVRVCKKLGLEILESLPLYSEPHPTAVLYETPAPYGSLTSAPYTKPTPYSTETYMPREYPSPTPTKSTAPYVTYEDPKSYSEDPKPYSEESKPYSEDSKPYSEDPKPYSEDPKPYSEEPKPYSEDPKPDSTEMYKTYDTPTPSPTMSTVPYVKYDDPKPYSKEPKPYSKDPKPYVEDPKPYSEDPNPYSQDSKPYAEDPKPYVEDPQPYSTATYKPYEQPKPTPYDPYTTSTYVSVAPEPHVAPYSAAYASPTPSATASAYPVPPVIPYEVPAPSPYAKTDNKKFNRKNRKKRCRRKRRRCLYNDSEYVCCKKFCKCRGGSWRRIKKCSRRCRRYKEDEKVEHKKYRKNLFY